MSIQVRNLRKRFGGFAALDDVSLSFPGGELTALLGPSGCGKTTLLRIVAGLERADSGQVLLDGEDAAGRDVRKRNVGFVFQHYALFRHMSVFDNIAFGLRAKPRRERPAEAEIRRRVGELLELIQLGWIAERYPMQLSGGQRQRVALARALAVAPKVLLLDEPFGALDAKVRKELRRWLRRLHDELHITSVFVTHDQEEALEVADRVVVMNHGKVEQVGRPQEVYEHPATPFVFSFLGSVNRFEGRLHGEALHVGEHRMDVGPQPLDGGSEAIVFARPHELDVLREDGRDGLPAVLRRVLAFGPVARLELELAGDGRPVEVELLRERLQQLALREGEILRVQPRRARVFAQVATDEGRA